MLYRRRPDSFQGPLRPEAQAQPSCHKMPGEQATLDQSYTSNGHSAQEDNDSHCVPSNNRPVRASCASGRSCRRGVAQARRACRSALGPFGIGMYEYARAAAAAARSVRDTDGVARRMPSSRIPCVSNADPDESCTICAAAIPLPAKSPAKIEEISSLLLMVSYLSML